MSDSLAHRTKSWHHVGHRNMGNPFSSLGESWCNKCRMVVECDTESSERNGTFVWSRRCPRCGSVCHWGVYQNVHMLDAGNAATHRKAVEFVTKPGADRSGGKRGRAAL